MSRRILLLVCLAALFRAVGNITSSHVSQHIYTVPGGSSEQKLTAAMVYLAVGVLVQAALSLPIRGIELLANKHDQENKQTPQLDMHLYAVASALLSSLALIPILYTFQGYDSALIIPLSVTFPLLFAGIIDVAIRHKMQASKILAPAVLILTGAFLSSFREAALSGVAPLAIGNLAFAGLLLATGEHLDQKGTQNVSAIKYSVWRMIYLAVAGVLVSLVVAILLLGQPELYFLILRSKFWLALPFVTVVLGLGVFENVIKTRAKKGENARVTDVVATLTSLSILLGFTLTYGVDFFYQGALGQVNRDPALIAIRLAGISSLILGLVFLLKPSILQRLYKRR